MHSHNNDHMRGHGARRRHDNSARMGFGFSGDDGRRGRHPRGGGLGREPWAGAPQTGEPMGFGAEHPHAEHGPHGEGPHGRRGGGPRGGGPRGGGRGRGRAQRGDIRTATLLLLTEEPMHGYQIMQAIAERTGSAWRPSPGAIYPTIAQLEDEGLITITREGGRKLATLTEAGKQHVEENAAAMGNPFGAMSRGADGRHDLRSAIDDVQTATRIVAKRGTDAQIAAVHQILAQARKSIYLVLAEENDADAPAAESSSE
ncbi:PadR family transcriptional regulator [Tomitella biformata]|uniref:PadR family transcriptional regulator n=1 Tax=Tomitella biformata TaxID=630403 RepID=UPI0004665BFC|nr:PadR family transcriptional regulator [Tomitella biformata]